MFWNDIKSKSLILQHNVGPFDLNVKVNNLLILFKDFTLFAMN
jgi:hypothetical protein